MRIKALMTGALPLPHEGPWVSLEEGKSWRIEPSHDYKGKAGVQVRVNGGSLQTTMFHGEPVIIVGKSARGVISHPIDSVPHVSIVAYCLDGKDV